jgi:hypothetical protein
MARRKKSVATAKFEDSIHQRTGIKQEIASLQLDAVPGPVSSELAEEKEPAIQSSSSTEYVSGLRAEQTEGTPVLFFALIAAVWYLICAGVIFGLIS